MASGEPPPRTDTITAAMHRTMTKVTVVASFLAGVLMLFGFAFYLAIGEKIQGRASLGRVPSPTLAQLLTGREYLSPSAYLGLGLIILSLTPILRILVALTYFWQAKNKKRFLAAFGVLC